MKQSSSCGCQPAAAASANDYQVQPTAAAFMTGCQAQSSAASSSSSCGAQPTTASSTSGCGAQPAILQLAIASVPIQPWETPYSACKALLCGTIFPCLDKPFFVTGGETND